MRAFIAIELPGETKALLSGLAGELSKSGSDTSWVKPENIHLTLKFLGEIDDKNTGQITRIMEETAKTTGPFPAQLSSIGAFPGINFPRVIWVGVGKGSDKVAEIAKTLEREIEKVGIPSEDRPFSSHITIGRVRSRLKRNLLVDALNAASGRIDWQGKGEFRVTKITLYKSTLTPKGPVYETVNEAHLTTN